MRSSSNNYNMGCSHCCRYNWLMLSLIILLTFNVVTVTVTAAAANEEFGFNGYGTGNYASRTTTGWLRRRGGRRRSDPPTYKRRSKSMTLSSHSEESTVVSWILVRLHPWGYHDIPPLGELVSVLVDQKTLHYLDGTVTRHLPKTGEFLVEVLYKYSDDDDEVNKDDDYDEYKVNDDDDDENAKNANTNNNRSHKKRHKHAPASFKFRLRGVSNFDHWLYLIMLVFLGWVWNLHLRVHDRTAKRFDAALAKELLEKESSNNTNTNTNNNNDDNNSPISGSYLGFVANTSEGGRVHPNSSHQRMRSFEQHRVDAELDFEDGLVSGSGIDSLGGGTTYTIKGHYSKTRVKWVETYNYHCETTMCSSSMVGGCHNNNNSSSSSSNTNNTTTKKGGGGMTVTVRGTYTKGRRLDCFFRSSQGVTGEFILSLKKKQQQQQQQQRQQLSTTKVVPLEEDEDLRRRKPCTKA